MGRRIKAFVEKYIRPHIYYFLTFLAGIIVGGFFLSELFK